MFSRVLPGAEGLASFFHDPRTSSLYGNTRNFVNVKLTYVVERKNMPRETKKAIIKQGIGSVFLLGFNDIGNKVGFRI